MPVYSSVSPTRPAWCWPIVTVQRSCWPLDQQHFRRLRPLWGAGHFSLLAYDLW